MIEGLMAVLGAVVMILAIAFVIKWLDGDFDK